VNGGFPLEDCGNDERGRTGKKRAGALLARQLLRPEATVITMLGDLKGKTLGEKLLD